MLIFTISWINLYRSPKQSPWRSSKHLLCAETGSLCSLKKVINEYW